MFEYVVCMRRECWNRYHVEHIRVKLGASDRTQAVVQALELGLIELPGR